MLQIAEFFSVSFVVIVLYLGIHSMNSRIKPATKMLISMFLGTLAYSLGKLILISVIIEPYLNNTPR